MNSYIYALTVDGAPIYIGCTAKPEQRLYLHKLKRTTQKQLSKSQAIIMRYREQIVMEILEVVDSSEEDFWERFYISLYRSWGFNLANQHQGGCPIGCNEQPK